MNKLFLSTHSTEKIRSLKSELSRAELGELFLTLDALKTAKTGTESADIHRLEVGGGKTPVYALRRDDWRVFFTTDRHGSVIVLSVSRGPEAASDETEYAALVDEIVREELVSPAKQADMAATSRRA